MRFAIVLFLIPFLLPDRCLFAQDTEPYQALLGAWDVTVTDGETNYPSWFEVEKSGYDTLVGRYVGQLGSARPISEIHFQDGTMTFQIPPQWEQRSDPVIYQGHLEDGQLTGTTTNDQGETITWTAKRAPSNSDPESVTRGNIINLFNGRNLEGWHVRSKDAVNAWTVKDGILTNQEAGSDLISNQTFQDFHLRAQFRYPEGSNSGLYLRGRYEVQIEDHYGLPADSHHIGGVYGFLTPSYNAAKPANQWQEYEITLIDRRITVILNDVRIIDHQLLPGITGGALDSHESEPGPLMIQGDHGPVQFRKLELTPLLRR